MRKPALLAGLTTAAVAAAVALPADAAVTIRVADDVFKPKSVTVKKGTTLVFRWVGRNPHNVIGAGIKSGTKTKGTFRAKARKSGTLVCSIHPGMTMKLRVR